MLVTKVRDQCLILVKSDSKGSTTLARKYF